MGSKLNDVEILELINYPSDSEASFCSSIDDDEEYENIQNDLADNDDISNVLIDEDVERLDDVETNDTQIRNNIWYVEKENDYNQNIPEFRGVDCCLVAGDTPLEFFMAMFPEDIFELIMEESIRYAHQKGKINFKITVNEVKIFVGINIIMSYIKYPRSRMYWSSIKGLRFDLIADSMSVNRFEEIKRYLHFTDNDKEHNEGRFWKIKPILDILHNAFHQAKTPSEKQSIDEMLIPFKGRSPMKQYLRNKPKQWGFKVWVRASSNGYVNCFEFYEGKSSNKCIIGPIADTVIRLCHDMKEMNYKLFMDNLFTSLPLLRTLQDRNIHVIGTLRINRAAGVQEKLKNSKELSRGGSTFATSSDNITVLRWKDRKDVHMISTYAGKQPEDEVKRWDSKTKEHINIKRPFCIQEYNMFMGGVDLMDRMIAHYPHGFKSKKWYLRIFFHVINMSLVNAWICYKEKFNKVPLLEFKAEIALALIKLSVQKKRGRPNLVLESSSPKRKTNFNPISNLRYNGRGHWPKKSEQPNASRCRLDTCSSKTRFFCSTCEVPLCPTCMESYHEK